MFANKLILKKATDVCMHVDSRILEKIPKVENFWFRLVLLV